MTNLEELPDDKLICYCKDIDKQTILNVIEKGATTLSDIKKQTTACTGNKCHETNPSGKCCASDITELLGTYSYNSKCKTASCCC